MNMKGNEMKRKLTTEPLFDKWAKQILLPDLEHLIPADRIKLVPLGLTNKAEVEVLLEDNDEFDLVSEVLREMDDTQWSVIRL